MAEIMNTRIARADRVTQAFSPMKKFDLAKLKQVYEGKQCMKKMIAESFLRLSSSG